MEAEGKLPKRILETYKKIITIRINEAAFNPFGKFEFLDLGTALFVVDQHSVNGDDRVLAIHNFSNQSILYFSLLIVLLTPECFTPSW